MTGCQRPEPALRSTSFTRDISASFLELKTRKRILGSQKPRLEFNFGVFFYMRNFIFVERKQGCIVD